MARPPLVILAGGKGTRLAGVTEDKVPKPMVDVFGKPFLYWLIRHYKEQGFEDITISTGHLAEVIEQYEWTWPLTFIRDGQNSHFRGPDDFYRGCPVWVVNGDTFIPSPLPEITSSSVILSCNDVDAGAQYVGAYGKIKIHKVSTFYDIGTPEGLTLFKRFFISPLLPPWSVT